MADESNANPCSQTKVVHRGGWGHPIYGLGFLGAAIYFISHAASFWGGVLGFLKAIVWPVFVVYRLMQYLGM